MREWDRLLVQAELTLNLLSTARVNPSLSAHTFLFDNFNYNKTPLVPPGTRVVTHTKTSKRASWELDKEQESYIGPSLNHHRCIKVFFPKTQTERDVDTIIFFPSSIPFPETKLNDFLKQAAGDIITLLTQLLSITTPTLQAGDDTKKVLLDLAKILNRADTLPTQSTLALAPATPVPRVPLSLLGPCINVPLLHLQAILTQPLPLALPPAVAILIGRYVSQFTFQTVIAHRYKFTISQ